MKFSPIGASMRREGAKSSGFTIIELMIAVAVLSVLLSIAVPSFRQFLVSTRLTSQANQLVSDLAFARNEAGTKSRNVIMCIAATSTTCATSGTDWATGWIIWSDINGNSSLDAATEILRYAPPLEGNVSASLSGFTSNTSLTFRPYGGLPSNAGGPGIFKICEANELNGRQISIPYTGRATATRISNCP
jgi:type IV fimbrial biogenesis protein FimT